MHVVFCAASGARISLSKSPMSVVISWTTLFVVFVIDIRSTCSDEVFLLLLSMTEVDMPRFSPPSPHADRDTQ